MRVIGPLAEVYQYPGRKLQRCLLDRPPFGAEHARLPGDDRRPARGRVDHGDAVRPEEFQHRLVRVVPVDHPQVGLVRITRFILVLVGGGIPRPGEAGGAVGVDETGGDGFYFDRGNISRPMTFADVSLN
jgi:hypothetical protein